MHHAKAMKIMVQSRVWVRITIISEAHPNSYQHRSHELHLYLQNFPFRMAFNQSLNANCDLNGYLSCKMPAGALEVQIKVKTTWGKFTMVQDAHTRIEKYHTWEKAQWCPIRSRKRRTPHQMTNMPTEDNASQTDIPTDQGFSYPPQIFTNPTHMTTMTHMESEGEMEQERKFLGRCYEFCDRSNESHCWCISSDWEEGLTNVNDTSFSIEKILSPTVRKPTVGWSTFRCRVIREAEHARPPSPAEEADTNRGINMQ